ncbi:hypothetical protein RN001_013295 [Aquatica leii]|uniref:Amidase domain-containing protein n=1 Tax=Aquatica leii TaxID=1421715 RepID=A0AAN7PZS4_9COLE|nr:hypothetical protein RN001_013295 [Aquatica leii]
MGDGKKLIKQYTKAAINLLHRFIELIARCLFKLIYGTTGEKMPPIKDLLLLESATSIAYKIRTKKVSSVQVLNSCIERIKEINPLLNCIVANRFEDALKEAQAADDLIKSGKLSEEDLARNKPFLGVPFTTKDCIAVKGMIHTSGLYTRQKVIAEEDADVIARLRNVGAIPIALTNVSELCMWWESANTLHGRTNNPYDTNRIVGGSSGGEGCNQAAAGSIFGIGSDIGGSIRMPAFFNGVFGHKPSKAIISQKGQYPIPVSEIQRDMLGLGPICRRAEDLLPIFKIIVNKEAEPKLKLDEKVNVKNIKFYYQDSDIKGVMVSPIQPEIKNLFKKITIYLKKAHKIETQKVTIERLRNSVSMWMTGMKPGKGPSFGEQLANFNGSINIPFELIKCCFRISKHTFVGIITAILDKFTPTPENPKHIYMAQECGALHNELSDLMGDDGVFLFPSHPTAAPYHNEPLIKPLNFIYTGVINVLGFPATHCPLGLDSHGLPIGIQVVANVNNDRLCMAVAEELEKAFGGWVPPAIEA